MENKIKYLLVLLLLVGCGTRKVNKSNTETTIKTEVTISDTTKIVTNTSYDIDKVVNDFYIEPIDTCKAIVIIDNNGKKTSYLNAKIRHKRETSRNKTIKNEIVQSSRKENIKSVQQTKTSVKEVQRKISIITEFWWLWLLILAILLYYLNKRLNLFA
jgi:hypothetical protein